MTYIRGSQNVRRNVHTRVEQLGLLVELWLNTSGEVLVREIMTSRASGRLSGAGAQQRAFRFLLNFVKLVLFLIFV